MPKTSLATLCVALVVALVSPCHAQTQGTANATTSASLTNGDMSAVGGDQLNVLAITNQGGAPHVPPLSLPQPPQAQIFGALQKTAGTSSIGIIAGYLNTCKGMRFSRNNKPEVRESVGESGKTEIRFFPSPLYMVAEKSHGTEVEFVEPPSFVSEEMKGVLCLGTVTVFPKDGTIGFETVMADVLRFPFEQMKGFTTVHVIALPAGIASASGVTTSSASAGLAVGLAHVASLLTSGLITPSISGGNGSAKPQDFVGGTFVLLAQSGSQTLNTGEFGALLNQPTSTPAQTTNPGTQYERK